ncbi:MAG TPA: tripartite tricarboxylate transporter substrate binding protein [Burkholderiales bacterium]|nr:tripartite tricarboxylate transporter substrate binding protein [Burkholderiales bacterium]
MSLRPLAVLALAFAACSAHAQAYPTKTVHMLVGFAPGGANDILARIVGQKLADSMRQPVVVDNRPGAAGLIAAEALAKSAPDGYTLMLGSTGTQTMAPHLTKLHYDALDAFTPISLVGSTPNALVVRPTLPVQDVRELIEYSKTRPRLLTYASSGNGTTLHLAAALFAMMADVQLIHVSYKGNAPALTDVMGGQVDMMFSALPPLLPLAKAGKLKILGVGSLERHRSAPDLPTIAEQGLPDYESGTWYGVFAPANLPAAVLDRLGVEMKKAIDDRKVREQIIAQGVDPKADTPAEFRKMFRDEYARWGAVIKKGNIKAD